MGRALPERVFYAFHVFRVLRVFHVLRVFRVAVRTDLELDAR